MICMSHGGVKARRCGVHATRGRGLVQVSRTTAGDTRGGGLFADKVVAPALREVLPPFLSHTIYLKRRPGPKIHPYNVHEYDNRYNAWRTST